jgi:hypothetical protein
MLTATCPYRFSPLADILMTLEILLAHAFRGYSNTQLLINLTSLTPNLLGAAYEFMNAFCSVLTLNEPCHHKTSKHLYNLIFLFDIKIYRFVTMVY